MSTRKPTAGQRDLVHLIVNFYIPSYFHIKTHPSIQDGAGNLFYMLTLSRDLKPGSKATVERVLQGNAYFAHHENAMQCCETKMRKFEGGLFFSSGR